MRAAALRRWAAAVYGCTVLPPLGPRVVSTALEGSASTRLGQAIVPLAAAHPGRSGVLALPDGSAAFAARVLFARSAERSLDVQYCPFCR